MASPSTSPQNKFDGFTLIEVLIAMVILAVIFSLGLFISFDFYKSYSARQERDVVISILQKARSQAMDNIDQSRHGVHFASPLQYVLFECNPATACTSYTGADTSKNISIAPAYGVSITGTDVVFDQLTGNCDNPATITVTANGKTQTISINSQGRIDW